MNSRKPISSTLRAINELFTVVAPTAVSAVSHYGIQLTRNLDASELKDQIKDTFSYAAFSCDAAMSAYSLGDLCITLISAKNLWSQFTTSQKVGIALGLVCGLGASSYSLTRFGVEQNTFWSGCTASAGVMFFNCTKDATGLIVSGLEQDEEERLTLLNRQV